MRQVACPQDSTALSRVKAGGRNQKDGWMGGCVGTRVSTLLFVVSFLLCLFCWLLGWNNRRKLPPIINAWRFFLIVHYHPGRKCKYKFGYVSVPQRALHLYPEWCLPGSCIVLQLKSYDLIVYLYLILACLVVHCTTRGTSYKDVILCSMVQVMLDVHNSLQATGTALGWSQSAPEW